MPAERRVSDRYSRRLEVRYWRRGREQSVTAYTTNVSASGLFLSTNQALEPGERLRLEVQDSDGGFVIEAQVVRVHRVSVALRHVEYPGAGVRFLAPEELIGALVPAVRRSGAIAAASALGNSASSDRAERQRTTAGVGPSPMATGPAAAEAVAAGGPPTSAAAPAPLLTVPVEFTDRASFLSVYHRDLSAGTLFVSTDVPAALNDQVVVEIRPPAPADTPLRFLAVVVRRFEPEAAVGPGRNLLAGMGVRFADAEALKRAFEPVLARLRQ